MIPESKSMTLGPAKHKKVAQIGPFSKVLKIVGAQVRNNP